MNTRLISIFVGLVLVIGVGALVHTTKKSVALPLENTTTVIPTSAPAQTASTTQSTSSGITLAQIAKHNSRTSCWSAINGSVYNLTSWIPNHPGGEQAILSLCGIDGSSGYNTQHGGSPKPAQMLAGFKIGVLAK